MNSNCNHLQQNVKLNANLYAYLGEYQSVCHLLFCLYIHTIMNIFFFYIHSD